MLEYLPEFDDSLGTYLFVCFAIFSAIQLLIVALIYSRLAFHKTRQKSSDLPGLSIIIAARNEADNLFKNLPFIFDQDYPNFEVVVINHQSMDDSKYILDAYEHEFPNMKVITVEKSEHLKYGKNFR